MLQLKHEIKVRVWNLRQRFRLGKHHSGPLELIQRKRVGEEIVPGVPVKILHRDSRFRGETGLVVNIAGRGEYGAQVIIRMDRDNRILRFPLTYTWGRWSRGFPSLLRLSQDQDMIRVVRVSFFLSLFFLLHIITHPFTTHTHTHTKSIDSSTHHTHTHRYPRPTKRAERNYSYEEKKYEKMNEIEEQLCLCKECGEDEKDVK